MFHTTFVFYTSGGLGPAAKTFYKRLASLIAEKHDQPYSLTLFGFMANLAFCCSVQSCVFVAQDHHTI